VLPFSHKLGATLFPHQLSYQKEGVWNYCDDEGKMIQCNDHILTGKAGYVGVWHNCTLHGTMPVKHESERFRLSLRYLIGKSNKNQQKTTIDVINSGISGIL